VKLVLVSGRDRSMNHRAASEIFWIVMVAVLVLVVLAIMLWFFTSKSAILQQGLTACDSKGGVCIEEATKASLPCPTSTYSTPAFECGTGKLCCLGLPKDCTGKPEACGKPEDCRAYPDGKSYCI